MDGSYTKVKKFLAFFIGLGVLYASIVFSKDGFGFTMGQEYTWVGWLLAGAATTAQFMVNSDFRKLNWLILVLGVSSYLYSIYTNMLGFENLRGTGNLWDVLNVTGSIFMDLFPEAAISWAVGESNLGDIFGNLIKTVDDPSKLTYGGKEKRENFHYPDTLRPEAIGRSALPKRPIPPEPETDYPAFLSKLPKKKG